MRANTALCFILSGLSLFFFQTDSQSHSKRLFAQMSATIVFFIALGTLIQYGTGLNFGIDEFLFKDTTPASILFPGRMAPISAVSFILISFSFFSLDIFPGSKVRISELLSLIVLLLGYISLLGYCFSLQSFFHYRGYDVMALNTAIAFIALAVGVFYSRPNHGIMSVITGKKWGALMWRNLLPAVIILPIVLGAIVESMETYFSFGEEYDSAIMASTLTILFISIIWYNARSLNESENKVLYANRLYALLSGINKSIVRGEDIKVFFEHACSIAVERGGFRMAWIGQKNEQTKNVDVIASAGFTGNYLNLINIDLSDPKRCQGPTGRAIQTGLHHFSTDIELDPTMQPWKEEARKSGYRSSASFPIILTGKVWGSFTVYSTEPHYFIEQEIALLDEVALDIAHAIEVSNKERERKIATEQLHNSETRFRRLYETTPFAYQSLDGEAKILDVNNAWLELLGYEIDEVIGRPIFEFLVPDHIRLLKERIPAFISTGILHNAEFNFLRKDTSVITVSVEGRVGYDEQGRFKQTHCVLYNITERKNSELRLQEYTLKLEQAEQYTNLGSWELDLVTGEGWWSKQMYAMLSIEESKKVPDFETYLNHVHPVDRPLVQTELSLMLEGKEVNSLEYRSNPEYGDIRYFVTTVHTQNNFTGKPVKYRGTLLDITERKLTEQTLRKSEQLYRLLAENATDVIWILDMEDYLFRYVSPSIERLRGYTVDEVLTQFLPETLSEKSMLYLNEVLPERIKRFHEGYLEAFTDEIEQLHKDGHTIWTEVSSRLVLNPVNGRLEAMGVARDITERKKAEVRLKQTEQKFRVLIEKAPDGVVLVGVDGDFKYVSPSAKRIFGYDDTDLRLYTPSQLTHPDDLSSVLNTLTTLIKEPSYIPTLEYRFKHKNGSWRWIQSIFTNQLSEPLVEAIVINFRDITENKEAQAILLESEEKYRTLIESQESSITTIDKNGVIHFSNAIAAADFNLTPELFVGKNMSDVFPPEIAKAQLHLIQNVLLSGKPFVNETESIIKNQKRFYRTSFQPIRSTAGENVLVMVNAVDITERRKADAILRESEERFSKIFQSSPIPIALTTIQGKTFIDVNDAWQRMMEYSRDEVIGASTAELNMLENPAKVTTLIQNIQNNESVKNYKLTLRTKSGRLVDTLFYAEPLEVAGNRCILSLAMDISEQKHAEEKQKSLQSQLQQAQKLESLGTLASGIAHDFNNILGIIIGHASLLEHIPVDRNIIKQNMDAINNAGARGASLVKQLLTFARKTDVLIEPVRINDIVAEASKLLYETFPKTITFSIKLEKPLPYISADTTQIHQVLLNLCVNARDAMPDGGTLSIVTSLVHGESIREKFVNANSHEYIELKVADSGTGMDEHTKNRIFEPFFTTKGVGKGTGLGLSLVFGIVEAHKGFTDVDTELGKGTTFKIYFPVPTQFEVEDKPPTISLNDIPGGNETVLIIEDEDFLCSLLKTILETKGYNILTASNGLEGLEQFAQHSEQISLIVSDLGLPKLNGFDAFKQMKIVKDNVKFIIASGYLEPETTSKMYNEGVKAVIHKPYKLEEVLSIVRNTLDKD